MDGGLFLGRVIWLSRKTTVVTSIRSYLHVCFEISSAPLFRMSRLHQSILNWFQRWVLLDVRVRGLAFLVSRWFLLWLSCCLQRLWGVQACQNHLCCAAIFFLLFEVIAADIHLLEAPLKFIWTWFHDSIHIRIFCKRLPCMCRRSSKCWSRLIRFLWRVRDALELWIFCKRMHLLSGRSSVCWRLFDLGKWVLRGLIRRLTVERGSSLLLRLS